MANPNLGDALYSLEERAGICEFDGGMTREDAERLAVEQLQADDRFSDKVKAAAVAQFQGNGRRGRGGC